MAYTKNKLTTTKGKRAHLNNKEHLLAKRWTIYDSERLENIGMMMEFQPNKTFVMNVTRQRHQAAMEHSSVSSRVTSR